MPSFSEGVSCQWVFWPDKGSFLKTIKEMKPNDQFRKRSTILILKDRSFNFKFIYNGIKTVSMVTYLVSSSKMQIQNVIHRCILTSFSACTWNNNVYSFFALLFFSFREKCDCVIVNYWNNNNNDNNKKKDNDDNNDILKGPCQLESMCAEVMQITFNCQNSIVFNAWLAPCSLSRPRLRNLERG